jgi:hypothetical protein
MAEGHLRFVWTTQGYQLREREGDVPEVGSDVEEDGASFRVAKVGPSPLPGDTRLCAYLQAGTI